jgi:hypothetical protein
VSEEAKEKPRTHTHISHSRRRCDSNEPPANGRRGPDGSTSSTATFPIQTDHLPVTDMIPFWGTEFIVIGKLPVSPGTCGGLIKRYFTFSLVSFLVSLVVVWNAPISVIT